MANKFYQFDYAEMQGHDIVNLGILYFETEKIVTRDMLKEYTKGYLRNPEANILISNVIKLSKRDFEKIKSGKKGDND